MPNMRDYAVRDYRILLAAETIDASKGVLYGSEANLEPRTAGRTILIGLGGTGVRTIDHVKGVITKKLKPTWTKYISFLGIDADWREFDKAKYLTDAERRIITLHGANTRMGNPGHRSLAQKRFMLQQIHLGDIEGPGSGRKRLVGKFKIHDQESGGIGVDVSVADRIERLVTDVMDPLPPTANEFYEVYVIGSVCGGTCSGGFLEMPAIIKKALGSRRYHVNALLYLPDTLSGLDPAYRSELFANGYASLKELDYYQGMSMRKGSPEVFSFNNPANPEVTLTDSFFRIPYLVGSTQPGSNEAADTAMQTIAEFLVSILGEIQSDKGLFSVESFMDNALKHQGERLYLDPANKGAEHPDHNHDRPRSYAAVGFAEASAPEKIVRAYTVARACIKLGLAPVSREKRDEMLAHNAVLPPFRGEDHLMTATEGTAKAREIMTPVLKILDVIHGAEFEFAADLSQPEVTWQKIKNGDFDGAGIQLLGNNVVENRTSATELKKLDKRITDAFVSFKKNVQSYVETEGPLAFFNLFKGNFIPSGDDHGMGIEVMVRNLCDGKLFDGRRYGGWASPEETRKALNHARNEITITTRTLFNGPLRSSQQDTWVTAYNEWMRSRINAERRSYALGDNGKFYELFLTPATLLADELRAFGHILAALTGAYQGLGQKMDSFAQFVTARDNMTEVNIAAVDQSAYKWIAGQVETTIKNLNAVEIRRRLVTAFFADPTAWLDIPENCVTDGSGDTIRLVVEDVAVPARTVFDQFIATELPPMLNVSVQTMFEEMRKAGVSYDTAARLVVSQLAGVSVPQFNGNISADYIYVVYPSSLRADDQGKKIIESLKMAIDSAFSGKNPQILASDDANTIRMYQLAAPFEIYRLSELTDWEDYYEAALTDPNAGLHGLSPDLVRSTSEETGTTYAERIGWRDYPAITFQSGDPRQKNPATGEISHEGQRRIEMDKIIEEAKKLGVLYSEQTPHGWVIRRVLCDKATTWDRFNLFSCTPDPKTGALPLGRELAKTVAILHGKTLESISQDVCLIYGGVLETPRSTEELAWKYAVRVLYAHMPMYLEIRDTVENHFRPWGERILEFNATQTQRLKPAMMIRMMRARRLYRKPDGAWVLKLRGGDERIVANLTDTMKQFLLPADKRLVEGGLLAYFLFEKVEFALPGREFDDFYKFATECYQELLANQDFDALKLGKDTEDMVLAEAAALKAKGARLGDNEEVSERFAEAMRPMGLDNAGLKKIQSFYGRVSMELS